MNISLCTKFPFLLTAPLLFQSPFNPSPDPLASRPRPNWSLYTSHRLQEHNHLYIHSSRVIKKGSSFYIPISTPPPPVVSLWLVIFSIHTAPVVMGTTLQTSRNNLGVTSNGSITEVYRRQSTRHLKGLWKVGLVRCGKKFDFEVYSGSFKSCYKIFWLKAKEIN